MVKGYKCFNKDMTNRYGFQFMIGNSYSVLGKIEFGLNGNGFHMCKNLVDVFRYYDGFSDDFIVCEVIGSGEIVTFEDEYNGYFDMYSVECIEIIREIDRCEIIDMVFDMNEFNVLRFIQLFKLSSLEISRFEDKFSSYISVILAIEYYQKGNLDVYSDYYKGNFVRKRVRC